MPSPVDALSFDFMRLAVAELVLLAITGGLLGAYVVLRRLAFFTHAVGTATFPGLVAADAAGVSPGLGGIAVALGYAGGLERATRAGRAPSDAATGLLLVAALALGVVLASDVTGADAGVDRLLFGSLVGLTGGDLAAGGASVLLALVACASLGRAWVARGFDPEGAAGLGPRGHRVDFALLAVVAACVVAALPAVGALLVASLFVVPGVTARLLTRSVAGLVAAAVALALAQGLVGLYLAYWLDASPGPAVAATGAAVYGIVALMTAARARARSGPWKAAT